MSTITPANHETRRPPGPVTFFRPPLRKTPACPEQFRARCCCLVRQQRFRIPRHDLARCRFFFHASVFALRRIDQYDYTRPPFANQGLLRPIYLRVCRIVQKWRVYATVSTENPRKRRENRRFPIFPFLQGNQKRAEIRFKSREITKKSRFFRLFFTARFYLRPFFVNRLLFFRPPPAPRRALFTRFGEKSAARRPSPSRPGYALSVFCGKMARIPGTIPGATLSTVACRLPSLACRLSPAACRLTSLACRLTPAACRLSPLACRLSPVASRLPSLAYRLSPNVSRLTSNA